MISILLTVWLVVAILLAAMFQPMGRIRFWGWVFILIWPISAVFLFCHAVTEAVNR